MSSYKSLNLNRSLIENVIKSYVLDQAEINKNAVGHRITYSIRFHNKAIKTALLLVFYLEDGTTTLQYGTGKNPNYSQELAAYIMEKTSIHLIDVGSLYFKEISQENINILFDFIPDIRAKINETKAISNGIQHIIQGEQGEKLSIICYNNHSILFQGRPSFLFNQIMEILVEIFPPNDVLSEYLGYYKIKKRREDFEMELESIYPCCYNKLTEKLRAVLLPAIALRKISIDGLDDYSFIAYPSLRCLEGIMKSIFLEYGMVIDNRDGFKDCFKYNHTQGIWESDTKVTSNISVQRTCEYLAKMYTIYHNSRHSLFHVDALVPVMISKEEAISITDKILSLIEEFYS